MQRLIALWLALCLLAAPMLVQAGQPPSPAGDALAAAMIAAGCEQCAEHDMNADDCPTRCAQAACMAMHCVAFLPAPLPLLLSLSGRQPMLHAVRTAYRSYSPGLPVRPPIV